MAALLGQEAVGGGTAKASSLEQARAFPVGSPAAEDTLERLAFTASSAAATSLVLAIAEDSAGVPGAILAETEPIAVSGAGTYEGAIAATVIKPSKSYWLIIIAAAGGSISYKAASSPTQIADKNSTPTKVTKASSVTGWAALATEVGGPIALWGSGKEGTGGGEPAESLSMVL